MTTLKDLRMPLLLISISFLSLGTAILILWRSFELPLILIPLGLAGFLTSVYMDPENDRSVAGLVAYGVFLTRIGRILAINQAVDRTINYAFAKPRRAMLYGLLLAYPIQHLFFGVIPVHSVLGLALFCAIITAGFFDFVLISSGLVVWYKKFVSIRASHPPG